MASPAVRSLSQNISDQIDGAKTANFAHDIMSQIYLHNNILTLQNELSRFKERVKETSHIEVFKDIYQNTTNVTLTLTLIFMIMGTIILPTLILYLIVWQKTRERNAIFRCVHEQALSRPMQKITKNRWREFGEDNILKFLKRGQEPLTIEKIFHENKEFHENNAASKKYYQRYIDMTKKWKSLYEKINKPLQQSLTRATKMAEKNNFSFESFQSMIIWTWCNMLENVNASDTDRRQLITYILKEPIKTCIQDYENKYLLNTKIACVTYAIRESKSIPHHINKWFLFLEKKLQIIIQDQNLYLYLLTLSESASSTSEDQKKQAVLKLLRQSIVLASPDFFQTLLPCIDTHIKSSCTTEIIEKLRKDLATFSNFQKHDPLHNSSFLEMQKQCSKVDTQRKKIHKLIAQYEKLTRATTQKKEMMETEKLIASNKEKLKSEVEALSPHLDVYLPFISNFPSNMIKEDLHNTYVDLLQTLQTDPTPLWLDAISQGGLTSKCIDSTYQQYRNNCKELERGISQIQYYQHLLNKIIMLFIMDSLPIPSLPSDTPPLLEEAKVLRMMLSKLPEQVRHQWADLFSVMIIKHQKFPLFF